MTESTAEFHLTLTAPTEAAINDAMIARLREQGYNVTPAGAQWERPGEFLDRIGRCRNFPLRATIRAWRERGGTVLSLDGLSGRVLELLSNPEFDAFCKRNKTR